MSILYWTANFKIRSRSEIPEFHYTIIPLIVGVTNIIRVTLQVYVPKSSACMGELYLTRLAIVYGIVIVPGAVSNVLYILFS